MSRLRHAAPRLIREGAVDGRPRIREVARHRMERVAVGLHRSRRAEARRLIAATTVTATAVLVGWLGPVPYHQVQPIFVPAQPVGAAPDSPPPDAGNNPPRQTGQPKPDRPNSPGAASRSADRAAPTGTATVGGAPAQPEPSTPDSPPVGAQAVPPPPPTADTPTPLCPPQPGGKKQPKLPKPAHPHVDLPEQARNPIPPGQPL